MKLLINDTISISNEYSKTWLNWMETIAIPLIKKESTIESFRLTRIKGGEDENGITFALQFIFKNEETYHQFVEGFDPKWQQEQQNRFRGQFGSFRSVLEVLEDIND